MEFVLLLEFFGVEIAMEGQYVRGSASYYSILGVPTNASDEEIRRAYRKLAMQWHPDKWTRRPSLLGEAKRKFQEIQEAYSVLSDQRRRIMYDAGLYNPAEEEEDEGFADFLQEMASLVDNVRKEDKVYSLEELQTAFWEMAQSFETPEWSFNPLQCMHQSPAWFDEPSMLSSLGNSTSVSWSNGQTSARDSWSTGVESTCVSSMFGDAWGKPSYAF